ncbi:SsgA family sporulation/cell division regulator [Streptomyces sp. GESEQ-35]|uniref:SsgA family sporulation/cell division regulator n=1 Tax=Streptomyces sp. GESEQ-35 TaxID=2812657 RepID=UPI001B33A395|nr:SsgA family sporulation/cell division regulator [Streptomyces sp. GESEQ-35]
MANPQNNPDGDIRPAEHGCPDLTLTIWLHVSLNESLPLQARFSYDESLPLEVRVEFSNATGGVVAWALSRDLLIAGLHQPSGHGDVRIWPPCRRHDGHSLWVLLQGRIGAALLEIRVAPLHAWLVRTLRSVPFGTEGLSMDWDESFERVLAQWDR